MVRVMWADARPYKSTLTNPDLKELLCKVETATGDEWVIRPFQKGKYGNEIYVI
jgi:hypothetical protein